MTALAAWSCGIVFACEHWSVMGREIETLQRQVGSFKIHCKCKEMPVIPVSRVVDPKRIIGKNGGPRRRRRCI
jgi:hypothetical protein